MRTITNWGICRNAPFPDDIMPDGHVRLICLELVDPLSSFLHLSLTSTHRLLNWRNDCSINLNRN